MNIEEMFKGMAGAKLNGKGNYMGEGTYLVRSKVLKTHEGHKGKKAIFGFEIVQTSNPAHPIGSSGDYTVSLDGVTSQGVSRADYAWADLKAIIFALALAQDPKTVKDAKTDPDLHEEAAELFKAAVSEEHAKALGVAPTFLMGRLVKLEVKKGATRAKTPGGPPGEFNYHSWSPAQAAWDAPAVAA